MISFKHGMMTDDSDLFNFNDIDFSLKSTGLRESYASAIIHV